MKVDMLHGDCLELMKNIPAGSVDCVLCDPPYGTMRRKNPRPEVRLDDISYWDYELDEKSFLSKIKRVLRPNGKALIFSAEPYTSKLILANIPELLFCQRLAWKKNTAGNFLCSNQNCMQYFEDIVLFRKNYRVCDRHGEDPTRKYMLEELQKSKMTIKQVNYLIGSVSQAQHYFTGGMQFEIPTKTKYKLLQSTGYFQMSYEELKKEHEEYQQKLIEERKQQYPSTFNLNGLNSKSNIFEYSKDNDGYHPTQKPVALLEDLILTYSNEGETVLDNAAGSMSTVIACINTNRNCIAIEKDDHYYSVGCKRVHDHILENNIDLCYNQVCGGVCLWQSSKTEQVKDMVGF